MGQNRYLCAFEKCLEDIESEKGTIVRRIFQRILHPLLDMPDAMDISSYAHPMAQYAREGISGNRERLRASVRDAYATYSAYSGYDEDVDDTIRLLFVTSTSPLYISMSSLLTRYRVWKTELEGESENESDSE
jgi:hypothetical protein